MTLHIKPFIINYIYNLWIMSCCRTYFQQYSMISYTDLSSLEDSDSTAIFICLHIYNIQVSCSVTCFWNEIERKKWV